MKVTLNNIGNIKKAEYEVGALTVLCGKNNTGKTQAMYILYAWLSYIINVSDYQSLHNKKKEPIYNVFSVSAKMIDFIKSVRNKISSSGNITDISVLRSVIDNISFDIVSHVCSFLLEDFNKNISAIVGNNAQNNQNKKKHFSIICDERQFDILKSIFTQQITDSTISQWEEVLRDVNLQNAIQLLTMMFCHFMITMIDFDGADFEDVISSNSIVNTHIITVERSGITMFSDELNIDNNAVIIKLIKDGKVSLDELQELLLSKKYPIPVEDNIKFFTKELRSKREEISFIAKDHPEVLSLFEKICGGKFNFQEYGIINYEPSKSNKNISLQISSSSVRAMLHLSFYLHHLAKKGDMLMIDEPELNLHPNNQRLMSQMIAMLINLGVKVMLTTHSDYIVNEFNSLIMMKHQKEKNPTKINKIMKKYRYNDLMLLDAKQCKATIAKNNNRGIAEFFKLEVDDFWGIDTKNFDDTIVTMRDIKEQIITT